MLPMSFRICHTRDQMVLDLRIEAVKEEETEQLLKWTASFHLMLRHRFENLSAFTIFNLESFVRITVDRKYLFLLLQLGENDIKSII